MAVRIVLIDDHPMVLKGIEQLLQLNADFEVVATCGTASEGLQAVVALRPDVLLLDLKLPGVSHSLITEAVEKARTARQAILASMMATLPGPRAELSKYAPRIETMKINPEKIGALIGPGGKNIKRIVDESGCEINIAIRGLMSYGDGWANRHDLSSLRLLGSVGEPINPEAWRWYYNVIGKRQCPIMDTWWQTETGGFMITPLPITPLKPGSATRPFFGIDVDVVDEHGKPVPTGEEGYLVIKKPWPGMLRTVYRDPERYQQQYWGKFGDMYQTGDSARKDKDGYIWIIGRMDDVIKVSGYRLGTAEVESSLVSHPAVAEAAAIGLPHELKGNAIHTYVILRAGVEKSDHLVEELLNHVAHEMGPIAKPESITFVDSLPKTRSGKIMRRL